MLVPAFQRRNQGRAMAEAGANRAVLDGLLSRCDSAPAGSYTVGLSF